jgi:hypothetical protein
LAAQGKYTGGQQGSAGGESLYEAGRNY